MLWVLGGSVLLYLRIVFTMKRYIYNQNNTPVTFHVSHILDISEIQHQNITMYPNPATEKLTIALPESQILNPTILITDITGKLVSSAKLLSNINEIPLYGFLPGIYLVKIITETEIIYISKIIKLYHNNP